MSCMICGDAAAADLMETIAELRKEVERLKADNAEMLSALELWSKTGRLANSTNIVESVGQLVARVKEHGTL